MLICGIDVGAATAEAVIFDNSHMITYSILPTGHSVKIIADKVVKHALDKVKLSLSKFDYVVSTGWGRHGVSFANKAVTEIICHGKGAKFLIPSTRTVVDIGGQDSKVISLDENGNVNNFVMNDKCAAGAGRSMGIISKLVNVPLEDLGELSLKASDKTIPISSTCVVFARSEVLGFLRAGVPKNDVIAGASEALTSRVEGLLKRVGIEKDFVISGGIAKNIGIVRRLEKRTGLKAKICFEPQIVGALGAAIFARDIFTKRAKRGGMKN